MNNNEYDWQTVFLKDDRHAKFRMRGEISIRVPKTDVKSLQEDITELREQNGLLLDQVEELEEKLRDSEKRAFEWNIDCVLQEIKNKELPAKIADLEYRLAVVTQQRDNWREKYDKEIECLIEKDDTYNEIIDNVLHATELGLEQLEMEYGIRTEILSDDNIDFYKNQIIFLRQQLEENKQYSQAFIKQIENKDYEAEENKLKIKELEEKLHQQELDKMVLKHELELEKNLCFFERIFNKRKEI